MVRKSTRAKTLQPLTQPLVNATLLGTKNTLEAMKGMKLHPLHHSPPAWRVLYSWPSLDHKVSASVCWLLPTFQRSHTSTDPCHMATALASPLALCVSKSTDPTDHPALLGVSRGVALLRCTQDPQALWRPWDRGESPEDQLTLTCCRDIGEADKCVCVSGFPLLEKHATWLHKVCKSGFWNNMPSEDKIPSPLC